MLQRVDANSFEIVSWYCLRTANVFAQLIGKSPMLLEAPAGAWIAAASEHNKLLD